MRFVDRTAAASVALNGVPSSDSLRSIPDGLTLSALILVREWRFFGRELVALTTPDEFMVVDSRGHVRWRKPLVGMSVENVSMMGMRFIAGDGGAQTFGVWEAPLVRPTIHAHIQRASTAAEDERRTHPLGNAKFLTVVQFARGLSLRPGQQVVLCLTQDAIQIHDAGSGANVLTAPSSEIVEFDVGGPGAYSTDGGFVGGGSGLRETANWMQIADFLNRLTTRVHVETNVRIVTATATVVLQSTSVTPDSIRNTAPLVGGSGDPDQTSGSGVGSELRILAELHKQGSLSDEEYRLAKSRLLGS